MAASILILSGPTASGKSRFACEIAKRVRGAIINCDSKQVYRELPIITAQPTEEERQSLPHYLYGTLSVTQALTVVEWLELAKPVIDSVLAQGQLPMLVGGTGMYINSLVHGISPIPESDPTIRQEVRALHEKVGTAGIYQRLQERDAVMAERLKPGDTQRIIRAYEVILQTGKSLAEWQQLPPTPPYPSLRFHQIFLNPPREQVYANCNTRFVAMMEQGALEEIKALDAMQLDPALPSMKSHGVPELLAYLHGTMSLEDAITQAQANTRHYVKRQVTWFRNQMPEAVEFGEADVEQALSLLAA